MASLIPITCHHSPVCSPPHCLRTASPPSWRSSSWPQLTTNAPTPSQISTCLVQSLDFITSTTWVWYPPSWVTSQKLDAIVLRVPGQSHHHVMLPFHHPRQSKPTWCYLYWSWGTSPQLWLVSSPQLACCTDNWNPLCLVSAWVIGCCTPTSIPVLCCFHRCPPFIVTIIQTLLSKIGRVYAVGKDAIIP